MASTAVEMPDPLEMLQTLIGQRVQLRTKLGQEVRGTLHGFDDHLNLLLGEAVEKDGDKTRRFPMSYMRGDTVTMITRI